MYIGLGIFLLVTGAILRYALSVDISGISVPGIGGVLMWGGVLALFLSFIHTWADRQIVARQRNAAAMPRPPRAPLPQQAPPAPLPPQSAPPGYRTGETQVLPQEPPPGDLGSGRY